MLEKYSSFLRYRYSSGHYHRCYLICAILPLHSGGRRNKELSHLESHKFSEMASRDLQHAET